MMKSHALISAAVVAISTLPVPGAEIRLVPAGSSGPSTIVGDEIVIPSGGVRVELDVFISGWGPGLLQAYQAGIAADGSGFAGGTSGSLDFFRPPCTNDSACVASVGGPIATCPTSTDLQCLPGFIDTTRTDHLGFNINAVGVVLNIFTLEFLSFALIGVNLDLSGIPDTGPKYGGTFVLEVSPDAAGTFAVNLSPAHSTMFDESQNLIDPLALVGARITIGGLKPIPTVSTWGLIVMVLLLLTGGKIYFSRRRAMQA